ncbi:MAG TPA: hypothetical protein VE567_07775 [Sphingomonas sp.]|nr:hypothetical protein [Sphingomonas sp.]
MRNLIAAAFIAGLAGSAWAADCPNPQSWAKPERHVAARSSAMNFALKPGAVSQIALLPRERVTFATGRASRKGYAGLAAIDVAKAGTLHVLVGNRTYVDLVRGGKPIALAAEPAHPGCPGVRKALEFAVQPGRYLVELSGSTERKVMIATSLR